MTVKAPVKLDKLAYVILYVEDAEKALEFYRDILALEVIHAEGGWVELKTGQTTLALHSHDEKIEKDRRHAQPTVVFSVENVEKAYEDLKGRGVKFEGKPNQVCDTPDFTGRAAEFRDPWGNLLSIYSTVLKK